MTSGSPIVFAQPSVEDFYHTPHRHAALGLRACAGIAARRGFNTELFVFSAYSTRTALPLPRELSYLKPFLFSGERGPLSAFHTFRRFGPSYEAAAETILSRDPQAVLIGSFAFAYAESAAALARAVKKRKPKMPTAVGGAGPSVAPSVYESYRCFDSVLCGEAETVLPGWLDSLSEGRAGADEPVRFLPAEPADSFLPLFAPVSLQPVESFSLSFTRGCPRRCAFCANWLTHGRKFRKADTEAVLEVMAPYAGEQPVRIGFEDDNLLFLKEEFFEILSRIRKLFPRAQFTAENGLDYQLMDAGVVERLVEAGFRQLNLSLAYAAPSGLRGQSRGLDVERYKEVASAAARLEVPVVTYFICGMEGDSLPGTVENLLFLAGQPTTAGISLFYPVPGIPGFESNSLLLSRPRLAASSSAYPWTDALTTAQLLTAFRLSRLVNACKSAAPQWTGLLKKCFQKRRLYSFNKACGAVPVSWADEEMAGCFFDGHPGI
jgi:anaerobic magnesium-protoporphyrin IX monomethyl ester cyclase